MRKIVKAHTFSTSSRRVIIAGSTSRLRQARAAHAVFSPTSAAPEVAEQALPVYGPRLAQAVCITGLRAINKGQPRFKGQSSRCQTQKASDSNTDMCALWKKTWHCHRSNHLMILKKTAMCVKIKQQIIFATPIFCIIYNTGSLPGDLRFNSIRCPIFSSTTP